MARLSPGSRDVIRDVAGLPTACSVPASGSMGCASGSGVRSRAGAHSSSRSTSLGLPSSSAMLCAVLPASSALSGRAPALSRTSVVALTPATSTAFLQHRTSAGPRSHWEGFVYCRLRPDFLGHEQKRQLERGNILHLPCHPQASMSAFHVCLLTCVCLTRGRATMVPGCSSDAWGGTVQKCYGNAEKESSTLGGRVVQGGAPALVGGLDAGAQAQELLHHLAGAAHGQVQHSSALAVPGICPCACTGHATFHLAARGTESCGHSRDAHTH